MGIVRSEVTRGLVVISIIAATAVISYFNKSFAESQAGLIISGVIGGYFGVAEHVRRD